MNRKIEKKSKRALFKKIKLRKMYPESLKKKKKRGHT